MMVWCTTQQYFTLYSEAVRARNEDPDSDDVLRFENQLGIMKDVMQSFEIEMLPLAAMSSLATIFCSDSNQIFYQRIVERTNYLMTIAQLGN